MNRLTSRNLLTEREALNLSLPDLYFQLKFYEDAEEQGRLVLLPCKVGDTVYRVIPKCTGSYIQCPYEGGRGLDRCYQCDAFIQEVPFHYSMLDMIGETVFLTRKEAKAAMKEG